MVWIDAQAEAANVVSVKSIRTLLLCQHLTGEAMRSDRAATEVKAAIPFSVAFAATACTCPEPATIGQLVDIFHKAFDV